MNLSFDHFSIQPLDTRRGQDFYHLIDHNRERLLAYFPGTVKENRTLELTLQNMFVLDKKRIEKTYFPFVIIDTQADHYAGFVDIKSIDWRVPKGEVGYFADKAYEGRGLISRSLALVGDHMASEHGFKKLLSRAAPSNVGSCRVAEKAGFVLEGKIRNDFRIPSGELLHMNYYGKVF
jgi:RimJ/RimL family protein N-acetyltransferase